MASRKWIYSSLLPLLISSVVMVGVGTNPVRADSQLRLDGLGVNDCHRQFCQQSQLLSTAENNDVVLLIVETCCNTTISSVSDSSGLTFSERLSYASRTSSGGQMIWEYYAVANARLESDNITVVTDQCCYRVWGMQVLAVSGADTSTVFDQDPSVPATVSCPGPDCGDCTANFAHGACSASIQTTTHDFVIASIPINDAGPCGPHYPSGSIPGFTNITNQNGRFEVDYAITTEQQNYVQVDCNGTDAMAIVVDAIMASG
ncbi:MAG TPA: hypothetical protein VGS11_12185 [Candidatus Bathyarchaeia archaeon]|nr:hypothetical protein [Candidatus Bathyarchaeia archaeon]